MTRSLKLYHGSQQIVEFPRVIVSRRTKDFSWGFYCTINEKQAKRRALRNGKTGVVNEYIYTPNDKLKVLRFEKPDEEWARFIAKCRRGDAHEWDIVEGPMADDAIWNFVLDFMENRIPLEAFLAYAKFQHPTHQISFHTLSAFQTLRFVEGRVVREDSE